VLLVGDPGANRSRPARGAAAPARAAQPWTERVRTGVLACVLAADRPRTGLGSRRTRQRAPGRPGVRPQIDAIHGRSGRRRSAVRHFLSRSGLRYPRRSPFTIERRLHRRGKRSVTGHAPQGKIQVKLCFPARAATRRPALPAPAARRGARVDRGGHGATAHAGEAALRAFVWQAHLVLRVPPASARTGMLRALMARARAVCRALTARPVTPDSSVRPDGETLA
jgi:hypothetical protein